MFNFAVAGIDFAANPGSLEGVVTRAKSMLQGLGKEPTKLNFDFSKGIGPGVQKAAGEIGEGLSKIGGNLIKGISESISTATAGGGSIMGAIGPGMAEVGAACGELFAVPFVGEIVGAVVAMVATLPLAIARETKMTKLGIQTGSSGAAKQLSAGMRSTFTGSGIDAESLSGVTAEMASKGKTPEQITAQMKILGNISVATGESMEGMAEAMARTEASGRVTGRTLQAMRPVAEELAREYGVSTERIFAMAETGAIKINQLKSAMQALGGETGRWGNALATMQNTTAGQWSRLTAAVTGLAGDIGTSLLDALDIKDILGAFADWIGYLRNIYGLFTDIVPVGKMLGAVVWIVVAPLRTMFGLLGDIVTRIRKMIAEWKNWIYTKSHGLLGESSATQQGLATRQDAGVGGSFQTVGIGQLAEKMQSEAGNVQAGISQQQLAEQQKSNEYLAKIAGGDLKATAGAAAATVVHAATFGMW